MSWTDVNNECGLKYTPGVRIKTKWAKVCDLLAMPKKDANGHYDGSIGFDKPGADPDVDPVPQSVGFVFKDGKGFVDVKIRAKSGLFDDDIIGSGKSQGVTNTFTGFLEGVEENTIAFFDGIIGEEFVVLGQQKSGTWRVIGSIDDPATVQSGAKMSTDTEVKEGDAHGLSFSLMADTTQAARIFKNPVFA